MMASVMLRSAAVLGAGTMGAQIAAHLANAGVPVLLLDITSDAARDGLKRARALKPDPFFTSGTVSLIETDSFDAGLPRLKAADWIVEAIVEQLDVKRALLARVDAIRRPDALVSSNTSGIPIGVLAEGRSDGFRQHWLGTHFFNPPRYLKLLEIIPTPDTAPAVTQALAAFADKHLGKGVVIAKDTPNFIANRIGLFGVLRILEELASGRYTIEEIDAITGPALGRPKSATFRTLDITGLDILLHVARNLRERLAAPSAAAAGASVAASAAASGASASADGEAEAFRVPAFVEDLAKRGWIGEKAGQGFYRREKREGDGESQILTLDLQTMTYRPRQSPKLSSIDATKSIEDVGARIKALFAGKDRVGEFMRATLGPTLLYAARVAPEIAHSIDDIDRAMSWGFGWELGPFETIDAIGIRELLAASITGAMDQTAPPLIAERLAAGANTFRGAPTNAQAGHVARVEPAAGTLLLRDAREAHPPIKKNAGGSLVDVGDGVLALELHSKLNLIGGDTMAMITAGLKEAERNFAAFVIATDAANFSAGANLVLVLLEAQEGNWDEIDLMVRTFQNANLALRYAAVPVVIAPAGLTLGGGCEMALHADRLQAAAETYIGLVETGVGLIPGGGGTKEMIARAANADLPEMQRVFETIGLAKVATSAANARELRLLRDCDRITMNRDRLIADAKALALSRVAEGYQPPARRTSIPVGGESIEAALKLGLHLMHRAARISDHDALVGRTLAHIIAGGTLPHPSTVTEQQLLDLEREAFLKLCGQRKTLERIQHTLKTGKPLRN
jgi:3-hydroxyacyl-CoA dehydrogenase